MPIEILTILALATVLVLFIFWNISLHIRIGNLEGEVGILRLFDKWDREVKEKIQKGKTERMIRALTFSHKER